MKKVFAALLAVMLLVSLLAGCGGSSTAGTTAAPMAPGSVPMASAAPSPYSDGNTSYSISKGDAAESAPNVASDQAGSGGVSGSSTVTSVGSTGPANQKMIYTVSADIETTKFDDSLASLNTLINAYGAYVENSYVAGKNYADTYYGNPTYRSASFTIRVPADKLNAMTDNLSTIGNVLNSNKQSQNITIQFIDTESRLKACRAEETSLLAMLEKAETVEVILTIQSRLADVRYEIESLTSQLKNWQNQVDYSTITLNIREVAELSEQQPPIQRTYWEEIRDGFNNTLKGIGNFFKGLFKGLVVALPVLLILAVIAIIVIVIIRVSNKKARAARSQDIDKKE